MFVDGAVVVGIVFLWEGGDGGVGGGGKGGGMSPPGDDAESNEVIDLCPSLCFVLHLAPSLLPFLSSLPPSPISHLPISVSLFPSVCLFLSLSLSRSL